MLIRLMNILHKKKKVGIKYKFEYSISLNIYLFYGVAHYKISNY